MEEQAISGGALAVIKRMFEDPIPKLLPPNTYVTQWHNDKLPSGTYSPHKWADPLLLFKWQLGAQEDISEAMPATHVYAKNQFNAFYAKKYKRLPEPDYSVFGKKLKAMLLSYKLNEYDEDELEYITSSPEWAVAKILHNAIPSNLKDEAAIVRLLLLQIILTEPTELLQASSLVHQIAVNMNWKMDGCTGSWTPPPEISNYNQIGTETCSSSLYALAIDEIDEIILKDESLLDIKPSDFVYIPVCLAWSGMPWLMAYILSFTSTSWWNYAYTLDVEYSNGLSETNEGLPMKATFMPKAATVFIPGDYKYICLVVVDAIRAELSDDWQFMVCKGITASRAGNFEFAKKVHAYLGRISDPDVATISCNDISTALANMSYMFSAAEFRQLHLKASILATSRFNGFGCYPNLETDEKNIIGPAAFNNKEEMVIGGYIVPDLAKMKEEERRMRLHDLNFWRCDPLGFFTISTYDLKESSFQTSRCQYRLSVSTNDMRILRACGVFPRVFAECYPCRIPSNFLNETLGYASLMLGLTNWYLVEIRCTLFEHNYPLWSHEPIEYEGILPKITSDFVVEHSYTHYRTVDWKSIHFSGNVPGWFVAAIAAKFGHSFNIRYPVIYSEEEFGWYINENSNGQYDLSLLFASSKYELKLQRNHGPCFPVNNLEFINNMISWDMNRLLDTKKSQLYESNSLFSGEIDFKGIVELNVIILPKLHRLASGNAVIPSVNRIFSVGQMPWHKVSGLEWSYMDKDYLDWLGAA